MTTTTEEMLERLCDAVERQTVVGGGVPLPHSRAVGIALTAARAHLTRPPDPVAAERRTTEPEVEEAFRLNDPDSLIARLASDVWMLEGAEMAGRHNEEDMGAIIQGLRAERDALTKSRDSWRAKAERLLEETRNG